MRTKEFVKVMCGEHFYSAKNNLKEVQNIWK